MDARLKARVPMFHPVLFCKKIGNFLTLAARQMRGCGIS
jgi:hypothetical protein